MIYRSFKDYYSRQKHYKLVYKNNLLDTIYVPTINELVTDSVKGAIIKFDSLVANYGTINKGADGTIVCNKNQPKVVVKEKVWAVCNKLVRKCIIEHETYHLNDIKNNAKNVCSGKTDGLVVEHLNVESAIKHERPAYKKGIECLKKQKETANIICRVSLSQAIKTQEFGFKWVVTGGKEELYKKQ